MDNIEVESNGPDSLRSDVSSLLSLSAYETEFAELKQLVKDSEHYEQISTSSSTPEAHRGIEKLVKTNRQLEEALENANKQIERLVRNYRNQQNLQTFASTLDVENENYELKLLHLKLRKQSAAIQQERDELIRENAHLKVSLEECTLERDIRVKSINSLKEKICELHVANENLLKYISNLKLTQKDLNARLLHSNRSRIWYKNQLTGCQHTKSKLHGELIVCKSEIADYINQISGLTVDLIKCKNDYEHALSEKLSVDIKKCETLLASGADLAEKQRLQEDVYIQTIAELKEEISQIRAANLDNSKCKQSATIARNLSLETLLHQKDLDIKLLSCLKKDLLAQVECLRAKSKNQVSENQQLKRSLLNVEVKLQHRKREKGIVESYIQIIRDQLTGLNKIYEKVKNELYVKTAELATLKENSGQGDRTVFKLRQNKPETLIAGLGNDDSEFCKATITESRDQLLKVEVVTARNQKIELGGKLKFSQEELIALETPKKPSEMKSEHSDNEISENNISVLERITDDQKVELLFNNQPFPNSTSLLPFHNMKNCIEKLRIEEFVKGINPVDVYERRLHPEHDSAELQMNTIKELKILLQVKEREMQERRRKMDTNNRLLLRKIKEHMKGRNATEKQLKQLRELYNSLACDRNNLKMVLNARDSELKTLQELCEVFKVESEKQRTSILILEYQLRKIQTCWKCIKLQQNIQRLEGELGETKNDVEILQRKNNVPETKFLSQQQQIATLSSENDTLKNAQYEKLLEKLQSQLVNADENSEENKTIYSNELQTHSSNFHRFVEICEEPQQQVAGLQNRLLLENTNFQNHITDYKSLQNIIQVLHNDRSFLQRIARDLKSSLNSCMERNQKLQEHIRLFSSDSHGLNSRSRFLDDSLPLGNWDDTAINRLLQKCAGSLDKSVVNGLQNHLHGLRDEIFDLQEQILRRNS